MGETLQTVLFCIVFLSQVLLISWFYPRRIISRSQYVLQNFPPSTHPKAYPRPIEVYERWLRTIARVNLAIVGAGLLIIGLILGTLVGTRVGPPVGDLDWWIFAPSRSEVWSVAIVALFFMLQFVGGYLYINFSAAKLMLPMRNMPPPRVRTVELRRRRLFDFVSPTLLIVVALTNIAFIALVLYYDQRFGLPRPLLVVGIASIAVSLLAFCATVGFALRAPKLDPYQAQQDRHNAIKLMVQQEVSYCIAFPVLFAALIFIKFFPPVMVSLFVQGIALASLWPSYRYRVDTIDFDVYRGEAQDSMPDASARFSAP